MKRSQSLPKIYRYAGDGEGIPGLPHVISATDAEELGLQELLSQAIKNKTYVLIDEEETKDG